MGDAPPLAAPTWQAVVYARLQTENAQQQLELKQEEEIVSKQRQEAQKSAKCARHHVRSHHFIVSCDGHTKHTLNEALAWYRRMKDGQTKQLRNAEEARTELKRQVDALKSQVVCGGGGVRWWWCAVVVVCGGGG